MAEKEQIQMMAELLEASHQNDFCKKMNETTAGIGATLKFLSENKEPVTAGQISDFIGVSTARTAVILKKMDAKGLIIKETGASDARTTVVRLSELGRQKVEEIQEEICREVGILIDRIGIERLREYVDISKEIRAVMKKPPTDI